MANWCYTDFTFTGKEEEVRDFCNKIKSFISKERVQNGFGNDWLGNIVDGFGFNWNKIDCRGRALSVTEVEKYLSEAKFSVNVMTTWRPMIKMWDKIIEKYYPSVKYVFIAEEPGNEVFINTDEEGTFYKDRFCLELDLPEKYNCESTYYCTSEEGVVGTLNSIFGYSYDNYEQCIEAVEKELDKEEYRGKGHYVTVHKFSNSYVDEVETYVVKGKLGNKEVEIVIDFEEARNIHRLVQRKYNENDVDTVLEEAGILEYDEDTLANITDIYQDKLFDSGMWCDIAKDAMKEYFNRTNYNIESPKF